MEFEPSASDRKHKTRVSCILALSSTAYPHYDTGLNPGHCACESIPVANSMPLTRLVRTTTRASENVADRERPSKLLIPVDEDSQPQVNLPYE